ncbi:hypothetical protein Tco_1019529 [Tanacetum coccineum]|uniref:Uncharacterized protein n=1 Tax=Tanacetum coccineum TaxID=301880 RepID=A0ABQ5FXL5_9ASTR
MFGVNDLEGDEVLVESEGVVKIAEERINVVEEVADIIDTVKLVSVAGENINVASIPVSVAATTVTTADELTLAQALAELKSARPPTQGISFTEPSEATTTTTTTITAAPKPPQYARRSRVVAAFIRCPVLNHSRSEREERWRLQEHPIGNNVQGQFMMGATTGSQSRTTDKPAPVTSQAVQRKDGCSGSDSQNTQPGVTVARKKRWYMISNTFSVDSVQRLTRVLLAKAQISGKQAQKHEERDCTPLQRECRLRVVAELKHGDLFNSANIISRYLLNPGVSKEVKRSYLATAEKGLPDALDRDRVPNIVSRLNGMDMSNIARNQSKTNTRTDE